jgi:predicted nucleic acid-binding protein
MDEVVTILGRRKGFGAQNAVRVANGILASPRVFTVYVDEVLFKETLEIYPRFRGKLSLTDVSSVIIMKKYGVKEIFSHDGDFDGIEDVRRREKPAGL